MQLGQQLLYHPVALVHLEVLLVRPTQYSSTCGSTSSEDPSEQELDDELLSSTLCDSVRPIPDLCPQRVSRTYSKMISLFTIGADDELEVACIIWVYLSPSIKCYTNKGKKML